jgi:hypothetical protein
MWQMVEMPGFEPGTIALKGRCSTNWATSPKYTSRAYDIKKRNFVEFILFFPHLSLCNRDKKGYIYLNYLSSFIFPMISLQELIQKRKAHRPTKWRFGYFHRYLSSILIFILFLSQTVQVSWFDRADAWATDYRDIVSLVVDKDTYSQLRPKVLRYAADIQWYLKATRVDILVTPADIRPEVIAAHNEKLYYEWDGKSWISTLVGTILIGNVPIPVVHKDGLSTPSLYPYVDFDDKRFVFDERARKYIFTTSSPESSDVEIWHGVINPALDTSWQDWYISRQDSWLLYKIWEILGIITSTESILLWWVQRKCERRYGESL